MSLVATLTNYMGVILGTLIGLVVIIVAIVFYLLKIKKIATEEEHVDYSHFERRDATEYSKFDDIVSSGGERDNNAMGMITIGQNTFIGGIEVSGFNYHAASAEERERTMINTISFFNIIDCPIQMHQTSKEINISHNIEAEKECAKRLERELIVLGNEYKITADALEEAAEEPEVFNSIETRLKSMLHTIRSKQWQLREAKEMVHYMETVSDAKVNMKKVNQIMYSYSYNSSEDIEELTEAEIKLKAQKELLAKAQIFGGALENCGCTWKPLSADDLTDLLRRHYHPVTADDQRLDELLNSSYTALYVTSDALEQLERERRGDLEYERKLNQFKQEQQKRAADLKRAQELEQEKLYAEVAAMEA